ncbi:hexosaminidase D-like [Eleutherodactylus coqui]|uniref:hexosaminidase D-like n=1 Tax=Eleutherodactylus coqui TaxID=57060 RepID=UPI003461CB5B
MVYHLGEGQDSTSWLNNNKGDLGKMFLSHLENVVDFLHSEFPEKKLLMWDDMLRKLSRESIQGSDSTDDPGGHNNEERSQYSFLDRRPPIRSKGGPPSTKEHAVEADVTTARGKNPMTTRSRNRRN